LFIFFVGHVDKVLLLFSMLETATNITHDIQYESENFIPPKVV